jgi:hypothetical protein
MEYLPISGLEWDLVAQCHKVFHPDEERSRDQLKKKFNKPTKTKREAGDSAMPANVARQGDSKAHCEEIIRCHWF